MGKATFGREDRYLFISDLQIPFENERAFEFCKSLVKEYGIPKSNILCAGDEVDNYYGSLYKKDPNATHSPVGEHYQTIESIKRWSSEYPKMRLCESNHGIRWKKKALEAEIPEFMMRGHREALQAPDGWVWEKSWIIETKHKFMICHGDDYGGSQPHLLAAIYNGMSCAIGHHHSTFAIDHIRTQRQRLWGCTAGCLIDPESYAFKYAKSNKRQPILGTLVIVDSGFKPILHPMCDE